MRSTLTLVSMLLGAPFAQAHSPLPTSMGALGDSITAAAFGNWRRTDALFPWNRTLFFDQLVAYKLFGDNPKSIERRSMSWATGSDRSNKVISHARRLAFLNRDEPFKAYNAAVTGALARELKYQVPRLLEWSEAKLGEVAPDYVTILIGGNDICASGMADMTPTGEFAADVAGTIDAILTQSPRTHILLSSLPKLERLSQVVAGASWAHTGMKTCRDLLRLTRVCHKVMLADDPAEIERIAVRTREYNEALNQVVEDRRALYGDRIRFGTSVAEQDFTADDISIDCFHPGVKGQASLADHLFEQSWWSTDWDRAKGGFKRRDEAP